MEILKLDINEIKKNLNTTFLGKNIIYYEEVNSTQEEAKRTIKELDNGTYIVTDKQTKGKGTHDRIWYDIGYENICGTFVLTPNCHIGKLENITVEIARCVIEAIKKLYNIDLQIKYPNDIMCKGKKIVGILTESVTANETVKYLIVGIGINVNQTIFSEEIKEIATSLKKEYKKDFSREKIISELFNIFEEKYTEMIK